MTQQLALRPNTRGSSDGADQQQAGLAAIGSAQINERAAAKRRNSSALHALRIAGIRTWEATIADGRPAKFVRSADGGVSASVASRIHADDIERFYTAFETALANRPSFDIEFRLSDGNGVYHWASCWCSIVRGNGRSPSRLVMFESPLDRPPGGDPLTNGHAEESPDRIDPMDPRRRDGVLMAMMSHELRSPITTIKGNAHLLRLRADELPHAMLNQALTDIDDEADRVVVLLDDLMNLARLWGAHVPEDELEAISLAQPVMAVVSRHRRENLKRDVRLEVVADHVVRGVPGYIEHIVDNFVANAIKYSPAGTPVEIIVDDQREEVTVRVLDRGVGIELGQEEQMFTPFSRSSRTSDLASGSGIGLAVCQRYAEILGGRVWARRRPGGGSEFGFALPKPGLAQGERTARRQA